MKKLSIILFILTASFILFYAVFTHLQPETENTITGPKTIAPVAPGSEPTDILEQSYDDTSITPISLIHLEENEILLNTYSIDFNKDGYDDQIISVKNSDSRFITLIVGLYNPVYSSYERTVVLPTTIDQVQSFSYYVQDITATHTNTIVVTGFDSNNNSIMKIYMPSRTSRKLSLDCVLDLSIDGTIFIQQLSQISSYDLGQTDGASFPIWIYMPDPDAQEGSLDQIQIEYEWNNSEYVYKQGQIKHITGKSITAQELRKIQDGTIKTFATFLDGLWQKTSSSNDNDRFISFDYENKEINFAQKETQEIYNWNQSTLRRNGIMLMLDNASISSLSRRFDIALISPNEINVKIADNLGMTIGADPLWDGNYKKIEINAANIASTNKTDTTIKENSIIKSLLNSNAKWDSNINYTIQFTKNTFTAKLIQQDANKTIILPEEKGVLSIFTAHSEQFLELRSSLKNSKLTNTYRVLSSADKGENATTENYKLIPVVIQTTIVEEKNTVPIILSRTIQNTKDSEN